MENAVLFSVLLTSNLRYELQIVYGFVRILFVVSYMKFVSLCDKKDWNIYNHTHTSFDKKLKDQSRALHSPFLLFLQISGFLL